MYVLRHVVVVAAKRSYDFFGTSDFLAIDPNLGAVVDAVKLHPDLFAIIGGRNFKFLAIPPRNREGTVRGHFLVRELPADFVFDAGEIAEIRSVVGILVDAIFDKDGEDSFGGGSCVPA